MSAVPPAAGTVFGDKVRTRFTDEVVVWFTTVGSDGTPQPNPVWFIWDGTDVLTYNMADAKRIGNVIDRPRVSLNFNNGDGHKDSVVLTGTADVVDGAPPADANERFMEKYRGHMAGIGMDPAWYAQTFSVPIRIRLTNARGM